jgi:hypothetical protein
VYLKCDLSLVGGRWRSRKGGKVNDQMEVPGPLDLETGPESECQASTCDPQFHSLTTHKERKEGVSFPDMEPGPWGCLC